MLFTAYFDESGTHGPKPTILMAAMMATPRQWQIWDRRYRNLQQQFGFDILHSTEFKTKSGVFTNWPDNKCMQLVNDLTDLIRRELTEGSAIQLGRDRFTNEYQAPPTPKKMRLDSQYGMCFRANLVHLLHHIDGEQIRTKKRHRLNVVIEDGHRNVGDCIRIFDDTKARLRRLGNDLLGTMTKGRKSTDPRLHVADFLVYTYGMMQQSAKAGGLDYRKEAPEPRRNEAGLTFLELLPDALRDLKEQFQRDQDQMMAAYLARRRDRRG